MVCPNCGKESTNAKLCPECGHSLHDNVSGRTDNTKRKDLETSGQVFCPSCLSTNYATDQRSSSSNYYHRSALAAIVHLAASIWERSLEHRYGVQCVCLQCGERWWPKLVRLHAHYRKCVANLLKDYSSARCAGINGSCIELTANQLIVSNSGEKSCIIPYHTIAVVDHRKSKGMLYGRLTIRDKWHRWKRPPKTIDAVKKDKATVVYESGYEEQYQQIYIALKAIIEENKKAGLL